MLQFDMNLDSLFEELDSVKTKSEAAIRPAAQAGAQVYYDAVKATVPVSKEGHWFQGTTAKGKKTSAEKRGASYWYESGSLKASLYQVYSKGNSDSSKAEYHVAWNHRKVPYGFMVIHGTDQGAKGDDFIGKARTSVQQQAITAMNTEFFKRLAK